MRYRRTILLVSTVAVWASATTVLGQGVKGVSDNARVAQPVKQRLLVTPYSYPQPGEWTTMCQRIKLSRAEAAIIVMNPYSGFLGQLTEEEQDLFAGGMHQCRDGGHRVIGYVTTGQDKEHVRGGRRRLTGVKANVNRYYSMFPGIDGIFFDEMAKHPDRVGRRAAAAGELINAKFYKRAYNHVKAKPGRGIVIGNMGLAPNTDWPLREEGQSLREATRLVDVLAIFEGPTVLTGDPDTVHPYDTFDPPEWTENYQAKRFANLIYRAAKSPAGGPGADLPSITETCQLAASAARRAGRIYITSDNFFPPAENNPWNTPPEDELLACPTLMRIAAP